MPLLTISVIILQSLDLSTFSQCCWYPHYANEPIFPFESLNFECHFRCDFSKEIWLLFPIESVIDHAPDDRETTKRDSNRNLEKRRLELMYKTREKIHVKGCADKPPIRRITHRATNQKSGNKSRVTGSLAVLIWGSTLISTAVKTNKSMT